MKFIIDNRYGATMNRKFTHSYSTSESTENGSLNFELIGTIEASCRQQRSEAIFQTFASLITGLKTLPEQLAKLAGNSTYPDNKSVSTSLPYRRLNLHTE
jgi:hypothetical protein